MAITIIVPERDGGSADEIATALESCQSAVSECQSYAALLEDVDTANAIALTSRISTEEVTRGSADTSLTTRLSGEEVTRASADTSIVSRFSTADVSLATADTSLTTRLSTEEVTRSSAVSTVTVATTSLTTRLSTEEATRASADTSLATAVAARQPLDADLTAIAALGSAANKMPYSTGAQTWALADLTAAGRALLDDADAATQRATLGLLPLGTSVDNYGAIGDGTTDDTLAIRSAITAAGAGGALRFTPGKTYLLSGQLVPLTGQVWIGYGAKLKRRNQITTTTTGAIATGTGSTNIAVSSSASFAVGMHVVVWQSASVYDNSTHIITAIPDATHITVGTAFTTALTSSSTVMTGCELIQCSAAGFRIMGIEIDDNRANNTSIAKWYFHTAITAAGDYNVIEDCYLHDCVSEAIELGGIGSVARNNIIVNCGGNGIHFSGTTGGQAVNNYVKNVTILGSATDHADGAIIFSNSTGDSIITGNFCDTGLCGVGSIDSDDNSSVVIANNVIKNMTVNAIEGVFPAPEQGGKVTITGNLIYDSIKVDIAFTGSWATTTGPYDWIFSGNYLENTRLVYQKGFGGLISNNVFKGTANTTNVGIAVEECQQVSVVNNQITGFSNGIYVAGSNTAGVKIAGNTLLNSYNRGINFSATGTGRANSIEANTIIVESGYTTSGSYFGVVAPNNCWVMNNIMDIQATSTGHGISCPNGAAGVNGAIVQGNVIRSVGLAYAIRAAGGSQNNWIINNYTQQTVSNGGGASNTVAGNYTIN